MYLYLLADRSLLSNNKNNFYHFYRLNSIPSDIAPHDFPISRFSIFRHAPAKARNPLRENLHDTNAPFGPL